VRHARLGRGPREVALFQHLVKQAKALTVPPQQLDPVGPPAPEPEDRTRPRRFPDSAFDQRRQPVDPTTHVGHAAGEIDPHIPRRPDHAVSTQTISDDSIRRSMSAAAFSDRPLRSDISIIEDVVAEGAETLGAPHSSPTSRSSTLTGTKLVSGSGARNFWRHVRICAGKMSCRRATSPMRTPGRSASAKISSFASSDQRLRRSTPETISTRDMLNHSIWT
jgi:hypothetical protein